TGCSHNIPRRLRRRQGHLPRPGRFAILVTEICRKTGAGPVRVKLLRVFYAAFGVLLLVLLAACCAAWTNNAAAALGVAAVLAGALWALLRRFGPAIDRLPPRRFRALYGGLAAAYFVFLLVLGQ